MNKVFVLPPGESWIVDRFVSEWNDDNADISVKDPAYSSVIWLFADWCWTRFHPNFLATRKVITTIHHIVPEKFNREEFATRDKLTTVYHVPNVYTKQFIESLTTKPIHVIPYWANQHIWTSVGVSKLSMRLKYRLPGSAFI